MIAPGGHDDPDFIVLVGRLLDATIGNYRPAEVYLICIDQWFDAKWLNFSGKALGAVGVWHRPITIPPFHPNRVLRESHFVTIPGQGSFTISPERPIHVSQSSSENLARAISRVSQSAIFFWYSSSTLTGDRGSTMLYHVNHGDVFSWYASFHRSPDWHLERHRGISLAEIQFFLQHDGRETTPDGRQPSPHAD